MRVRISNSPTQIVFTAVRVFFQFVLHRQSGSGAVVMRDIPLDSAGDPGADPADQCRLDDMLTINEIIVIRLIHGLEQPAAHFGQDPDSHKLILQMDEPVFLVYLLEGQIVVERIRIKAALGALRRLAEIEDRVWFRVADRISGDDNVLFPHADSRRGRCGVRGRFRGRRLGDFGLFGIALSLKHFHHRYDCEADVPATNRCQQLRHFISGTPKSTETNGRASQNGWRRVGMASPGFFTRGVNPD